MNQAGWGNEEVEGDFSMATRGVSAWHFRANTCGRAEQWARHIRTCVACV